MSSIPAEPSVVSVTSTTRAPTHQDALLLVEILRWAGENNVRKGEHLLDAFDPAPAYEQFLSVHPRGSDGYNAVLAVMEMYETVAVFVRHGILDRKLVHDLLRVRRTWDRCRAIAEGMRVDHGDPLMWRAFEALATSQ